MNKLISTPEGVGGLESHPLTIAEVHATKARRANLMAKLKGAPDGKPVSSLTLLATTLHESMTVFTRAWVFGDSVLAAEISRGDWD